MTVDNFSVRWTGKVQAPVDRQLHLHDHRPTTACASGSTGSSLIDNWVDQAATTTTRARRSRSSRGSLYDIKMEYYEHAGLATARLLWAYPGQAQAAIPQSQLYPPANRAPVGRTPAPIGRSRCRRRRRWPARRPTTACRRRRRSCRSAWSRVSGPGTVTFSNPAALSYDGHVLGRGHLRAPPDACPTAC